MKHIRVIVIAALVITGLVTTALRFEIEPPELVNPTPTVPAADVAPKEEPPEQLFDTTQMPSAQASTHPEETIADESAVPDADETSAPAPVETPDAETPDAEIPAAPAIQPTLEMPEAPEKHACCCTVEIRCDTVTDTSKLENEAVIPFIPADGTILGTTKVEFTPGETAFDVLKRVTRDYGIHLEFRQDNGYTGGINIEGIGFLYDFDAGPLSGWMYKVNGQFANRGVAGFQVENGDALVWVYTCDLGMDVGDNSIW